MMMEAGDSSEGDNKLQHQLQQKAAEETRTMYETELARKDEEISRYSDKLAGIHQELLSLHEAVLAQETARQTAEMERQAALGQLESVKRSRDRVSAELDQVQQTLLETRHSFGEQLGELQGKLDSKHAETERLLRELEAAKDSQKRLSALVESLKQDVVERSESHESVRSQLEGELEASQKLCSLYKSSLSQSQEHCVSLEHQLTESHSQCDVMRNDCEQVRSELNEMTERYASAVKELEVLQSQPRIEVGRVEEVQGMSVGEVYGRYVSAMEFLEKERKENERLEHYLREIKREIGVQAPAIKKQRQDYQRVVTAFEELQSRYAQSSQQLEQTRISKETIQQRFAELQSEHVSLRRENDDLSRQIRHLLEQRQGSLPLDDADFSQGTISASMHLSQQLITFGSVEQLLSQNKELREFAHKVAAQNEELQNSSAESDDSRYHELETRYNEQTIRLEKVLSQLEQLRELYSESNNFSVSGDAQSTALTVGQSNGLGANEGNVLTVRDSNALTFSESKDYDRLLKESMEERTQLLERMDTLRSEKAKAESALERCRVDLEYTAKQLQESRESFSQSQGSLVLVQAKLESYVERIGQGERKTLQLESALESLQDKYSKANAQLSAANASLELVKASESRLLVQVQTLSAEKDSQSRSIDKLSSLHTSLREDESKFRQQLVSEKNQLRLEWTQTKQALAGERALRLKLVQDSSAQLSEAKESLHRLENAHAQDQAEISSLQSAVERLQSQLSETENARKGLESQLQSTLERDQAIKDVREMSGDNVLSLSREEQLALERTEMAKELTVLYEQVVGKQQEAANWRLIAEDTDSRLAQLSEASRSHMASSQKKLKQLQERVKETQAKLLAVQNAAKEREEELDQANQKVIELTKEHKKALEDAELSFADTKARCETLENNLQSSQSELERLRSFSKDTQLRYERELIEHAADLERSSETAEKLDSVQQQLNESKSLVEELQSARSEQETLVTSLREQLQHAETEHKRLSDENVSLLQRLRQAISSGASESDASELDQLSEQALQRAKRDRDIAEAEAEQAQRALSRLSIELATVRSSEHDWKSRALLQSTSGDASQSASSVSRDQLEEISTVHMLQENNLMLRKEVQERQRQVDELSGKLKAAEENQEPLLQRIKKLEGSVRASQVDKTALEEEIQHWQKRAATLLSRYDQIDPQEHQNALDKVEQLQERVEECTSTIATSENRLKTVEAELVALREGNAVLTRERDEKTREKTQLETRLRTVVETLEKTRQVINKLKGSSQQSSLVESLKTRLQRVSKELISLRSQHAALGRKCESLEKSLEEASAAPAGKSPIVSQSTAVTKSTTDSQSSESAFVSEPVTEPSDKIIPSADKSSVLPESTVPEVPSNPTKAESTVTQPEEEEEEELAMPMENDDEDEDEEEIEDDNQGQDESASMDDDETLQDDEEDDSTEVETESSKRPAEPSESDVDPETPHKRVKLDEDSEQPSADTSESSTPSQPRRINIRREPLPSPDP